MSNINISQVDFKKFETMESLCLEALSTCKEIVETNVTDDDETLNKVKDIAKEYCEIEFNMQKSKNAFESLRQQLMQLKDLDTDANVNEMFKNIFNNIEMTTNYMSSNTWRELFEGEKSIIEVKKKNKSKNNTKFEELDDSLMCSNEFKPPIDPITKSIIRNPLRNQNCGHVYDKDSIYNYMTNKKRNKCTYVGCSSHLDAKFLKPDTNLKTMIEEYLLQHSNSDSSDDE